MAEFQSLYRKKTGNLTAKETENTDTSHHGFHINFAVYGRVLIIVPKKDRKSNGKGS
jgi:hypothetical protein